jgi:diguanylate cyclase (GGDEF)-like protein
MVRFRRDKEAAFQAEQSKRLEHPQRWLLLAGGAAYGLAGIWTGIALGDISGMLTMASLALLAATLMLWGLSYTGFVRQRLELIPLAVALIFSAHLVAGLTFAPDSGPLRAALLFGALAAFTTLMSPGVQTALASIVVSALVVAIGFGVIFPMQGVSVDLVNTLSIGAPLTLLVIGLALTLDHARRESYAYRHELARRATTDDISGVSNRAHIHQLAQNEFGRARRYKEPLSIVMIEIDRFDSILENAGPIALDTLIQVFAGYCVVVMRHCDSFGRMGPKRFLALLPETPAKGAMVLANRMCRDLAALDVMLENDKLNFTVSIGAAEAHPNDKWAGDMLRRCAQALDDAIDGGRNQAVLAHLSAATQDNTQAPVMTDAAPRMMMPEGSGDLRQSA